MASTTAAIRISKNVCGRISRTGRSNYLSTIPTSSASATIRRHAVSETISKDPGSLLKGLGWMALSASKRSNIAGGVPLVWTQEYTSVAKWLLGTAGMVVGMIHIGGLTRLTMSGLSMTTWTPLGGLPPITRAEWIAEFERYKSFPEWKQRTSMTLGEFQYIYAWEYGHRMLGRSVGMAFMLPWMYYTARGRIPKGFQKHMAVLGMMGGTQGLIGWWMVRSGLGDDRRDDRKQIRVKPIRLTTHLSMAFGVYGALLWTGWDILRLPTYRAENITKLFSKIPRDQIAPLLQQARRLRGGSMVVTGLTAATIVTGALVAGNDAGRAYNIWPKMTDDFWIAPEVWSKVATDYGRDHPNTVWYLTTEDTATTQFNHRMLGQATGIAALGAMTVASALATKKAPFLTPQVNRGLILMGVTATAQVTLGIATLLNYVPIGLAALHQMGSVVVFTSSLYVVHSLKFVRHPALLKYLSSAAAPAATGAIRRTPVVAASKRCITTETMTK